MSVPEGHGVQYDTESVDRREITNLDELLSFHDTQRVTWVDVQGLGDEATIRAIGDIFELHPVALENAVNSCAPVLCGKLRSLDWVVYAKPPFAGPDSVLAYLGAYTHRIAISNHRILSLEQGRVAFRYRDYADGRKQKAPRLDVDEFIRRFLLHVLPMGFVRIRNSGLLANRNRRQKIARCRELLSTADPEESVNETCVRPNFSTQWVSEARAAPGPSPSKGHATVSHKRLYVIDT